MGSQCSAVKRGKSKESDYYKPGLKKDEVSSTEESGEKSPPLQPSLQEEGGARKEKAEEETLRRQEQDPPAAKLGCSEKSSALPHDNTVVEVNTPR